MATQKVLLLAFLLMAFTVVIYCRPMIDTSDIVKDIRDIENILNESDTDNSDDDTDDEEAKDSNSTEDDKDDEKGESTANESSDAASKDSNSSTEGAPVIKDVSNATDSTNTTTEESTPAVSVSNTTENSTAPATEKPAEAAVKSEASRKDHIGIGQRLTSEQKDEPEVPATQPGEFAKINPAESESHKDAPAQPEIIPPASASIKNDKPKDDSPAKEEAPKEAASAAPTDSEAPVASEAPAAPGAPVVEDLKKEKEESKEESKVIDKAPAAEGKPGNELKETSTQAAPKKEESTDEGKEVADKATSNVVKTKTIEAEENDDDSEEDEEGENITNDKSGNSIENSEAAYEEETSDPRTAAQTEKSKSDDVEEVEPENEDDRVKMFFISPYEREEAIPNDGVETGSVRQILTYPATNGHGWGHSHQWGPSHIWNSDYPYYAYGYSWGCGGHDDGKGHGTMKKSNIKAKASGKGKSESKSKHEKKEKVKGKSSKEKNSKKSVSLRKTDWICRDYMLVPATPRGPLVDGGVVDIQRGTARQNVYSKDVACNEEDQQCKQRQVIGSMAGGSLFGDGMGGLGMGFPGVPGIHAGLSGYNEMGGFGDHQQHGCHGGHCSGGGGGGYGGGFGGGGGGTISHFIGYPENNFWGERQTIPYVGQMYGMENSVKKSFSPKMNNYDYGGLLGGSINNMNGGYDMQHAAFTGKAPSPYNEGYGEENMGGLRKYDSMTNPGENQNYFGNTQGWANAGSFAHPANDFGSWNSAIAETPGNQFQGDPNNHVDNYFGGKEVAQGTPYIGNGNDYGIGRTVHSVMNAEAQGKLGLQGKISINGIHKNFSYKSKIRKHKNHKEKAATARQDIAMPDEQAMMEITKQRQLIGSLGASTLFADNVGGMGLGHPGVPQMSSGISGIPGEYGGTGGYSHGWNGEDQPGMNPHGFAHYAYNNRDLDRGDHDREAVYQQPQQQHADSGHRRTQILSADNGEYSQRVNQQIANEQTSQLSPQKMSEIERMVHDVSDSIDRTNRKLQAITAANNKRQITPAFTPVVSEPAAVPDIRYPVPAADRYPLGAGYIWPSANYGHQLGGPFAWSKSSTPTAEGKKGEKKSEKKSVKSKVDKKESKSKVETKKHAKKVTKEHKERRSADKSNSTSSQKRGTKRQFLSRPYERSTDGYPYHGGLDPQQQEQTSGDPSSFAPMMHSQMPQGLMPQMVPEPQQAMFSPNPLTPYGSDIRGMDYPMTSKRADVPKHKRGKEIKRKADQWD